MTVERPRGDIGGAGLPGGRKLDGDVISQFGMLLVFLVFLAFSTRIAGVDRIAPLATAMVGSVVTSLSIVGKLLTSSHKKMATSDVGYGEIPDKRIFLVACELGALLLVCIVVALGLSFPIGLVCVAFGYVVWRHGWNRRALVAALAIALFLFVLLYLVFDRELNTPWPTPFLLK